ncbi:carboxypeptidase-like regulatory domain-containing protein [Hymenobacter sp. 15J16-1T3B]|uniref:beta-sandwich domain-containing protein n=1 Tax=Hymenobacter sp. 15J16-1T3B TaxID=2886941 RepID=UPI001D114F3D|nr:DUF2012 domain-containing protein [Hymenobacter sp. 15J16-1T3B]MCC3156773.1 carboxypeptidase-like regulatory domain-containing protein [Hymenobacter sp. 15J16-1T3B]
MKTYAPFRLFLSVLALASVALYAPAAAPKPAAGGELSGTLHDGGSHEAIPQANVVLLRAADGAYVATAATRADGSFAFHNVPFGQYRLQPTVLGYEPMRPVVTVSAQQPHLALGTVEMMPYGATLAGVLVGTPEAAPLSRAAKVGNAGRYVLTSAHRQRLTASRPVQL